MFTVAPSNRSNTEVQNKRKEIPIVSKQEHFASMVFHHTRKTTCQKKILGKGGECGGEITYAHVHRRMRRAAPKSTSSHASVGRMVYTAHKLSLNMEYSCFIQNINHSEETPVLP